MGIKSTYKLLDLYERRSSKYEWDEFQDEIDTTSSYEQSTSSDILQQTENGLSFAVGSLVDETLEDIVNSETYQDVTQIIGANSNQ